MKTTFAPDRLRALVDAGIALSSELSLDALLQRIVETAAGLTAARYAALGVIDRSGTSLERFLTTGIETEASDAIGALPQGRGILGVMIRESKPLRLHSITDDPRSVGFPANHPRMTTFLGVPIVLRGITYGNLYLTDKEGSHFTDEDEELTTLLAAQAAVAIENARLYESSAQWMRQLESLNEIAGALGSEIELDTLLDVVARNLRSLVAAKLVLIALPEGEDTLRIAAADGDDAGPARGAHLSLNASKAGRVLERARSERVDAVTEDPEVDREFTGRLGVTSALYAPLVANGKPIGVVVAHDKLGEEPHFSEEDLRLAEMLAARAAIAVELSGRVSRDIVRRVVEAQEQERTRVARELHDETGQALTSILLGLKALDDTLESGESRSAMAHLRTLVVSTLQDVRALAVELRPSALDDFGLVAAVERLVATFRDHSSLDIDLEARLGEDRLPTEVETTLYRVVQEALSNIARHADARRVSILLIRGDSSVTAVVEDDGRGFLPNDARSTGLGLVGMRERASLVGGRIAIESTPGTGTTLVVEIPLR